MFVGVSIGVLLGLCAALGVALYLTKSDPFVARKTETVKPVEKVQAPKPLTGMPGAPRSEPAKAPDSAANDTTRFDFYRILPGDEGQSLKRPLPATATKEVFYLQAGAFQRASDADNLKARLALAGLEAQIQTATLDDKSVWHRVRLGPYSDAQAMSHARDVLRENKIEPSIVRQSEPQPKG
jgi:cell division protein FtsN